MKSVRTLIVVLAVSIVSAGLAQAQSNRSLPGSDVIRQLVPLQMTESLHSHYAMVRSQTLKNVIFLSTFRRNSVDLGGVVSTIAALAEDDDSRSNRRLAVAALRAVDTYQARRYLAQLGGIEDPEYQTLVAGVLREYQDLKEAGAL